MKRGGPLRRRSKMNSRPTEDLPLRREYLESNGACELKWMLYKHHRDVIDLRDESVEPHHVVGGSGRRADKWSNLIALSSTAHRWVHANPPDGRIVCLWKKLMKSELRPDEFREIHGMYLEGWLSIYTPKLQWVEPLWQELVEHVGMKG